MLNTAHDSPFQSLFSPQTTDGERATALLSLSERELSPEVIAQLAFHFDQELESIYDSRVLSEIRALGRRAIDCSGTGGSGLPHYNTSTSVAFVLLAAGARVVKFGNRAVTGRSGSIDFLNSIGLSACPNLHELGQALQETGIAFLSARDIYPTAACLAPVRRSLGVTTVLNLIGPLLNPVRPALRLMGVSRAEALEPIAGYVSRQGVSRAALVNAGRLDEASCDTVTSVVQIDGAAVTKFEIDGRRLLRGLPPASLPVEESFTPGANAARFLEIISGADRSSSFYQMVVLNAGIGIYAAHMSRSIGAGIDLACELIKVGAVKESYETARKFHARISS